MKEWGGGGEPEALGGGRAGAGDVESAAARASASSDVCF